MSTPPLPQNLEQCQQLLWAAYQQSVELEDQLDQAQQRVAELERILDQTAACYQELQQEHNATLEEMANLKRQLYGQRRERHLDSTGQQELFDLPAPSTQAVEPSEEAGHQVAAHTRRRAKRSLDLSHLPHHRHERDLPEDEKACSCCHRLKDRIGEDVTQILEYVPSTLEVHQHVRPKYACRYCKDGVSTVPLPPRPIPGSIVGAGLLAQIVVSKYGDHLPLYRQEDILVRHGLHLSRSTLCDWIGGAAKALEPLYQLQRQLVLESDLLWTDDTPVRVLRAGTEGTCQGRFWVYLGDEQHPYSVYDFSLSRKRDGPQQFLEGYCGYLHADAYTGYDGIFLGPDPKVIEVACWAHARRKFYESRHQSPVEAHQVLEWIGQLYDIEDQARDLCVELRLQMRQEESNRVLDKIEGYLPVLEQKLLPKSGLTKAVVYARNQWQALRCYTSDGRLTIDNNNSERTLRPQAVGRKNWLFCGSEEGGKRGAILYSILAGAKRHHLEPWAYLRDLLQQSSEARPRWEEMLPDRWALAHPELVLSYRLEESRRKAARQKERRQRRRTQSQTK